MSGGARRVKGPQPSAAQVHQSVSVPALHQRAQGSPTRNHASGRVRVSVRLSG